jgi:hypothetical protein
LHEPLARERPESWQLLPLLADRRAKNAELFAEPPNGGLKLRNAAQQDGGAEIGAHGHTLCESCHSSKRGKWRQTAGKGKMWRPPPFPPALTRIAHPGAELPAAFELVAVVHRDQQRGDGGLAQTVQVHHCCWAR